MGASVTGENGEDRDKWEQGTCSQAYTCLGYVDTFVRSLGHRSLWCAGQSLGVLPRVRLHMLSSEAVHRCPDLGVC